MSDDLDPLTNESTATPISHRGILMVMAIVIIAAAIAGFVFDGKAFGLGVLFGGVLSFANYFWLERSTRAIFSQTALATTGILAAKYILRYAAIGLILLLVYKTDAFPIAAVILGLASFAFAVVIQGLKNIFLSTF
ncbi:MAG: ATP synthase subunit I [Pyrinomonadaceae bacterium]